MKVNKILGRLLLMILTLFAILYSFSPFYLGLLESSINRTENKPPYEISQSIRELHSSLFVADLHADTLFSNRGLLKKSTVGHVDLPRLKEGNIALQVFGVPTKISFWTNTECNNGRGEALGLLAFLQHWPFGTWWSPKERAFYQAEKLHKVMEDTHGDFIIIKTSTQLADYCERRKTDPGIMAGMLALEGAHVLDRNADIIDELYSKGFRIIGLTHFIDNAAGGSAHGVQKGGLTEFGREVLRRMEELNLIVDLSHASPKLIDDVLDSTTRPVIVSHTGARGCADNNRNLSDEQIKRIAEKGGLIGVGFWKEAAGDTDVKAIAASIIYISNLVGAEHVALGSDFDGGVAAPFDAAGMPQITEALVEAGLSREDISLIMGGNALRFMLKALPE